MASQARLRANGRNGSAHIQYHGFCVGKSSQNQATVRNTEFSHAAADSAAAARQASQKTITANTADVISRARRNGTRVSSIERRPPTNELISVRHVSGTTANHARSAGVRA